jgi:hypothetical protein
MQSIPKQIRFCFLSRRFAGRGSNGMGFKRIAKRFTLLGRFPANSKKQINIYLPQLP